MISVMPDCEALAADLLQGRASVVEPHAARAWKLAGWAHYTAAEDTILRRACAADFALAWVRVRRAQTVLGELFEAWQAAGVDAMVFKGFVLAHLAYAHPALRHFDDIDVYVPPQQIEAALAALPAGWSFAACLSPQHAAGYLRPPDRSIAVDLHHSLFPLVSTRRRHLEQITRRLLQDRIEVRCGQRSFPSLAPADLALIGVAVNRGWGGDRWCLKASDYLDLSGLRLYCGLSGAAVAARAGELGLGRTWRAFSRACDPERRVLQLQRSHRSTLLRLRCDLHILPESRALPPLSPLSPLAPLARLLRAPAALSDVLSALPTLWRVRADLHRGLSPAEALAAARWPRGRRLNVVRGVRWGMRLLLPWLPRRTGASDLVRSIGCFRLLAAQGHRPEWVSGRIPGSGTATPNYSWVEIGGEPVDGFRSPGEVRQCLEVLRVGAAQGNVR